MARCEGRLGERTLALKRLLLVISLLAAVAVLLAPSQPSVQAGPGATITVDSTADTDSRDGVLSLREAMLLATSGLAFLWNFDAGECA